MTSRSRPQSIAPVYISGDTICPPRRAGPCLPNFLQLSSLSKQGFQSWKGSETHTNDGARRARRAISEFIWLHGEALGVLSALGSEVSQPPPSASGCSWHRRGRAWGLGALGAAGALWGLPLGVFWTLEPSTGTASLLRVPSISQAGSFSLLPSSWGLLAGKCSRSILKTTRGHRSQRLGCWAWVADALRHLVSPQPVNGVFFTKPFSRTVELRLSCRK